jgi:predicted nuclease of predicted toxin-antitoxin system
MTSELIAAGHEVVTVADVWSEYPGDESILAFAHSERRVVVTRDKDFGELAILQGRLHAGIIRLWNTPARMQASVVLTVIQQYETELTASAIITASPFRIRIRSS